MLDPDFSKIANALGLMYPPAFWLAFNDLVTLSRTAGFQSSFPRARFIHSIGDIRKARKVLPHRLTPFLLDERPKHTDYYCFTGPVFDSGNAVVVFADHAIVGDWTDFTTFLVWLTLQSARSNVRAW